MNTTAPLKIIALDNCWEQVHPDVVYVSEGFAGYQYWMAFTPYPKMDDRVENPTIRVSHDGMDWQKVLGISDPVVHTPSDWPKTHHADTELVYSSGHLYLIYLTIQRKTDNVTFNAMGCNSDLRWSKPQVIHEDVGAVSPTFQIDGNVWHEWFIRTNFQKGLNRSELVHREGSDLGSLENERPCHLDIPKHVLWHIDILKVKEGYEGLVCAFPSRTDQTRCRLFHVFSKDGLNFNLTRDGPIIEPSPLGWDNRLIYRSSFLKYPDGTYRIWYSGASWGRHFGIGLLQGSLNSLIEPANAIHAPVPRYVLRLPGEADGWLRYQIRHNLPPSLLVLAQKRRVM